LSDRSISRKEFHPNLFQFLLIRSSGQFIVVCSPNLVDFLSHTKTLVSSTIGSILKWQKEEIFLPTRPGSSREESGPYCG
jgi:hypothetical protein